MEYNLERDGVTQSLLQNWLACRYRTDLILKGWQLPLTKDALWFGDLFHLLLEIHYTFLATEKSFTQSLLKGFFQTFEKNNQNIKQESIEKFFAMAEALYFPYVDHWEKDDKKKQWISLEPEFEVDFQGFKLRGKIDGIFKIKDKLWLLETKTKSQVDEKNMLEMLAIDFQNLFYIVAAELLYPKEKIVGVLYNIIRKPQLKFTGSFRGKKESLQDFSLRMQEDIKKRPEHYFKRYEVKYTKQQLIIFKEELSSLLNEFQIWNNLPLTYYKRSRNRTSCIGRWNCEFLQACAQGNLAGYVQTRKLFPELAERSKKDDGQKKRRIKKKSKKTIKRKGSS